MFRDEFKKYQVIRIVRERNTYANAIVLGILGNGEVLVEIDGQQLVIDREDIVS